MVHASHPYIVKFTYNAGGYFVVHYLGCLTMDMAMTLELFRNLA